MSILYTDLAQVYHEMYQSIFDYEKDFKQYHTVLREHNCTDLLELGCGSGNLATRFARAGYRYTGADISSPMLAIAIRENPGSRFLNLDMRNIGMHEAFDGIIITGRSFTYLTDNESVMSCLRSVHEALRPEGVFMFDNFDAVSIFSGFTTHFDNSFTYGNKRYRRTSRNSMNLETGWTWNWHAVYYLQEEGEERELAKDVSVLRAFTEDELRLFLHLAGFETEALIQEGSAFMTIAAKRRV